MTLQYSRWRFAEAPLIVLKVFFLQTLFNAAGHNLQKRPITHTYTEAGSFGRTQFCRYDVNALVDDYIIISLDVNEAQQQLVSQNNLPEESGTIKVTLVASTASPTFRAF